MEAILFFLAAAGAIGGAVAVVTLRNPFFSVLALVCHLFSLAVLFLLLSAQFLAAAQLIVYAGAVMVLYVFVVSYVGGTDDPKLGERSTPGAVSLIAAGSLLAVLAIAIAGTSVKLLASGGRKIDDSVYGTPEQIGDLLLGRYLLPFELASFLLTIVAIAAVVLAGRRRGLEDEAFGQGEPRAPLLAEERSER